MTLPAPSVTRSCRMDVPFGSNNTTTTLLKQFGIWALYRHMVNGFATEGVTGGTRHANSVWTVEASSNGTTFGAGDRWTSTFTPSALVGASNGTAHSWMQLSNPNAGVSGLRCWLDLNTNNSQQGAIIFAPISATVTGGSLTQRPGIAGNAEEIIAGVTAANFTTTAYYFVDQVLLGSNYSHYITDNNGNFTWLQSRLGTGLFYTGLALIVPVDADPDPRNFWIFCHNANSGRGAFSGFLSGASAVRRLYSGAPSSSQQGAINFAHGGINLGGALGPRVNTGIPGDWLGMPILLIVSATNEVTLSGRAADFYYVGNIPVGSSYPNTGASQQYQIVGDLAVPIPGVTGTV